MAETTLTTTSRELVLRAQAIGALGAELELRRRGAAGDRAVRDALGGVVAALGLDALDATPPTEAAAALGIIIYTLQEALDLIRDAEREPGWSYTDPDVLQERGRSSRVVPGAIARLAQTRPALAASLAGTRGFLDVGTGVGWIAIEAARRWPHQRVVGLDLWEPALAVAERNLRDEGLTERVELRRGSVIDLADENAFDVIWLPAMFIPKAVMEAALRAIVRALAPGGHLVFGMFRSTSDALSAALTALLVVRSGGHPWSAHEVADLLRGAGLIDVEDEADRVGVSAFALARKP